MIIVDANLKAFWWITVSAELSLVANTGMEVRFKNTFRNVTGFHATL